MSDAQRLESYRRERKKALLTVSEINNGRRYYEPRNGQMSDVTLARLQYSQRRADVYEKLEKLWDRNHGRTEGRR
jgi:hypothetical protein